ncbi:MAG: UDP-4-amino-4,6-dideoxy-N-acetyl-beta-L-altrosamine transaminase [Omnitrophica WOR_2 bacterium SM23_72]|nr:MAG: UDP-4-amino-4,6-dideoxy-N-acetyl-beta-L-altrosamine transaminase [Omnitrophica WOR_2 bacterium SM23_72]
MSVRNTFLPFYRPCLDDEEEQEITDTLRSGWIGRGPKTERFEKNFKEYVGSKYAIGVSSCTAGLHLSLKTIGIEGGDEVITTPMSFPAAVNAIVHQGAKPVFVDIEKGSLNMDPGKIRAAITKRTKAIVVVHFAGRPCEMNEILRIAKRNNIIVIEDAAHALGSEYQGRKIGSITDLACFSFHATKNITTGEGGMVTTDNAAFAKKIQTLSLQGMDLDAWERAKRQTYRHWDTILPGYKYNMFDLQAALGLVQLRKLEGFLKVRQRYTQIYNEAFRRIPEMAIPVQGEGIKHSYHLYVVRLKIEDLSASRDQIMDALQRNNIGIGVHYRALHLHSFYQKTYGFKKGDFPIAEYMSDRVLSLPLYPKMNERDINDVISAVKKIIAKYRKRKQGGRRS